jgi:tocopherol O-methyltransferase
VIASKRPISTADVADHYDELDGFYRDLWGEHVHHGLWANGQESPEQAVRQLVEVVAEHAALKPGSRVLDVGCGYGAAARLFAGRHGAKVTAITLSSAQYRYAKELEPGSNPTYLLGDWFTTEFSPESFDAAIAIESFEHMGDKLEFFHRAFQLLVPRGRLVVCAWLAREDVSRWQSRWLLEPICREGRIPHLLSAPELIAQAEAVGFTADRCQDLTQQVWRTWSTIIGRFSRRLLSNKQYQSFLLDGSRRNRVFALTIGRVWLAYRTGGMRYGIFQFHKGTSRGEHA